MKRFNSDQVQGFFSVQLGNRLGVVINRQHLAVEVLQKKGNKTSSRLRSRASNHLLPDDLIFEGYNERWRFLRKFVHSALFTQTTIEKNQAIINQSIDSLIERFREFSKSGTPISINHEISTMSNELILTLLFGRNARKEFVET